MKDRPGFHLISQIEIMLKLKVFKLGVCHYLLLLFALKLWLPVKKMFFSLAVIIACIDNTMKSTNKKLKLLAWARSRFWEDKWKRVRFRSQIHWFTQGMILFSQNIYWQSLICRCSNNYWHNTLCLYRSIYTWFYLQFM